MLTVGWSWHLGKCGPGVTIWSSWLQESGWPSLDHTLSWHLHPPTSLCHFTCLASGGIRVWAPVYFSQAKAQIALVPLVEKQKTKHTCLLLSLNSLGISMQEGLSWNCQYEWSHSASPQCFTYDYGGCSICGGSASKFLSGINWLLLGGKVSLCEDEASLASFPWWAEVLCL